MLDQCLPQDREEDRAKRGEVCNICHTDYNICQLRSFKCQAKPDEQALQGTSCKAF